LILCYHAVSSTWPSVLAVPPAVLADQLTFLSRRGYVGLTFADAERRRMEGTLPRRSVVVTFDDGYHSTLTAVPILAGLRYPATVFVVTAFVDSGRALSWPGVADWLDGPHNDDLRPLGWDDLLRLSEQGWEVGSHTATHPELTRVGDDVLAEELGGSRAALSRRLGRCETVAYPYGLADERVAAAAAAAGYDGACTLTRAHRVDDRYRRARVGLYAHDRGLRLRAKASPLARLARRSRLGVLAERVASPPLPR